MEPNPTCIHIRRDGTRCDRRRYGELDMCEKHTREFIMDAVYSDKAPAEALATLREDVGRYFMDLKRIMNIGYDPRPTEERRARALENADDPWVVYYIRRGGGRIKIGTSRNLRQRMAQLYAEPDDVLATEPGGYEVETQRHKQFAHLRRDRTELFEESDELLAWIKDVRRTNGPPVDRYGHLINDGPRLSA